MSVVEFEPPLVVQEVISRSPLDQELVSSITLLLRDSHKRLFTLHVATDANHQAASQEFGYEVESATADLEPVLVTHEESIDDEIIDGIITSSSLDVLERYLVPQID